MPTLHLTITGKVQGVFYRATAKEVADKLGITGWIQNTPGDEVEAVISGTDKQLAEFIEWCHQGPDAAEVQDVVIIPQHEQTFAAFEVVR